jgi:hypothetical protein
MKLAAGVLLVFALQGVGSSELEALRERAAAIREQENANEITTEQARRRVQLVVRDLEAWADEHDAELELKTRTYTPASEAIDAPLSVDRCSLFFEDDGEELCLVDVERTEIWGAKVLFCRYLCE